MSVSNNLNKKRWITSQNLKTKYQNTTLYERVQNLINVSFYSRETKSFELGFQCNFEKSTSKSVTDSIINTE
jgi:hypothetical protein